MAEVVEAEVSGESGSFCGELELAVEVALVLRRADRRGEDEVVILPESRSFNAFFELFSAVSFQDGDGYIGEGDAVSASDGLRRGELSIREGDRENEAVREAGGAVIRRVFPYVPLGCRARASMAARFVLVFVIALPFTWFTKVALVVAMILGPFTGWILATALVYLVLSPGERRRSREFHERQRQRAEYLKHLREERDEPGR